MYLMKHVRRNRYLLIVVLCACCNFANTQEKTAFSEGGTVIEQFFNGVEAGNIKRVKKHVIPKDHNLLEVKNGEIILNLLTERVRLHQYIPEDGTDYILEEHSTCDPSGMTVYSEFLLKGFPFYVTFYLKESSNNWKLKLSQSFIQSLVTNYAHPSLVNAPETDSWTITGKVDYSTLTDFDRGEKWIFAGSKDGKVRLFDRRDRSVESILLNYDHRIEEIEKVKKQPWLVVRSDHGVQVWDIHKRAVKCDVQTPYSRMTMRRKLLLRHAKSPTSIAVSDNGKYLAVGYLAFRKYDSDQEKMGVIEYWDLHRNSLIRTEQLDKPVRDVAISEKGNAICVMTTGNAISYLQVGASNEYEQKQLHEDHFFLAREIVFSSKGKNFYILTKNKLIKYHPEQGIQKTVSLQEARNSFDGVTRHPKTDLLVLYGGGENVQVYDGTNMTKAFSVNADASGVANVRIFSETDLMIGYGNKLVSYDTKRDQTNWSLNDFRNRVAHVSLFSDGSRAITIHASGLGRSGEYRMRLLHVENGSQVTSTSLTGHVTGQDLSSNNRYLALSKKMEADEGERRYQLQIRNPSTFSDIRAKTTSSTISSPAFTKQNHVLYGVGDSNVRMMDPENGKILKTFHVPARHRGEDRRIRGPAATPDGKFVLCFVNEVEGIMKRTGRLLIWNRNNGQFLGQSKKFNLGFNIMEFSGSSELAYASGPNEPLTTFRIPSLEVAQKYAFLTEFRSINRLSSDSFVYTSYSTLTPHHLLDTKHKRIMKLPGVNSGALVDVSVNRQKNVMIGGTDTGEIYFWQRDEER
jgi:WD40 repeat protein